MVHIGSLPAKDRLVLAELYGLASRWGIGHERDAPRDQAVALLQAVTRDPRLLGIAAGAQLADPLGLSGPAAELLRAAGADMAVAEEHAGEVRARLGGTGSGHRT